MIIMKLPRQIIRKINKDFSLISHSVSGGMDSIYSLLQLLDDPYLKVPIQPQFNNTGVNLKSALEAIALIDEICPGHSRLLPTKILNWNDSLCALDKTRYSGFTAIEIVKDSYKYIPKAEQLLLKGTYSKKVFPCCWYLKHKPFEKYAKSMPIDTLFTKSIRGGEGRQRQMTLGKMRKENRWFNFDKRTQRWFFYPLRDTKFKEIQTYLLNHNIFWNTKHSGCKACPVLKLFNMKR